MKIDRLNDNWNKVKTREELIELLKGYKGILTTSMINYLNSLIELDFSVVREYISDSDRKVLSELEIYRLISIYNIYYRAQNLFEQQNGNFILSGNNDGFEGLSVSTKVGDRNVKLFDFSYLDSYLKKLNAPNIPSNYKNMNIGNISLFQTFENKELREAELDKVMKTLERLYDEQNPYPHIPDLVGGPGVTWEFEHKQKIKQYEEKFEQLDSKKELTDEDKREIEATEQIHDLLLEDFGLTNKCFKEEKEQSFPRTRIEKTKLSKTLVKRMPGININNNIKYI